MPVGKRFAKLAAVFATVFFCGTRDCCAHCGTINGLADGVFELGGGVGFDVFGGCTGVSWGCWF